MFVESGALREFPAQPMLPCMARGGKSSTSKSSARGTRKRNPPGTNPPGRPAREPEAADNSHGARLRRAREEAGFDTIARFAKAVGIDARKLGEMERGRTRIDSFDLERLSRVIPLAAILHSAPTSVARVPRRFYIAAFETEGRPDDLEPTAPETVALPHDMPPELRRLPDLFAATVADDSAGLDYAIGTTLYLRALDPGEAISYKAPVVVRFLRGPRAASSATHEVLYGHLNRLNTGELMLQSRGRGPAQARQVQAGIAALHSFHESSLAALRQPAIEYMPRPEDIAEIVGVIVWADGPPRPPEAEFSPPADAVRRSSGLPPPANRRRQAS